MQSFADKYFDSIHSLMLTVATIVGFWVGVVTFFARSFREWYTNGGKESTAKLIMRALQFVNTWSELIYYRIEDATQEERTV